MQPESRAVWEVCSPDGEQSKPSLSLGVTEVMNVFFSSSLEVILPPGSEEQNDAGDIKKKNVLTSASTLFKGPVLNNVTQHREICKYNKKIK